MSFLFNPFSIKKTKPRQQVSRSPLKLPADEMFRELGPKCDQIDIRIAERRILFDKEYGDWNTGMIFQWSAHPLPFVFSLAGAESLGGSVSSGTAQKVRKQIEVLQEENNMLKLKADVLLNLVAESVAELSSRK